MSNRRFHRFSSGKFGSGETGNFPISALEWTPIRHAENLIINENEIVQKDSPLIFPCLTCTEPSKPLSVGHFNGVALRC